MKSVPISKFTFGIECENYVTDWPTDHEDTTETRSRKFDNFNGVLIYYRNIVKRHMDDSDFVLHSDPENYDSSASAHIHFKANVNDWDDYSFEVYDRLYELIKLFQVFFKNSPGNGVLSKRHSGRDWCELHKVDKSTFSGIERDYNALTPNRGVGTLEFRYMDVPKSLNQLSIFYYILNLAIDKNIEIPKVKNDLIIHKLKEIDKPINEFFSYKDLETIDNYKSTYRKMIYDFLDEVEKKSKLMYYDFYGERYVSFKTLIKDSLKYEFKMFKKFFKNNESEEKWSEDLKKRFCKSIKINLIKE